jgi:hypothetical protein
MTSNAAFLLGGLALLAAWVALVRFRTSPLVTFVVRGALAATILAVCISAAVPTVTPREIAPYALIYLIMISGPVAGAAFVFSLVRRVLGIWVYLAALGAASAWFGFAFKRYVAG